MEPPPLAASTRRLGVPAHCGCLPRAAHVSLSLDLAGNVTYAIAGHTFDCGQIGGHAVTFEPFDNPHDVLSAALHALDTLTVPEHNHR